VQESRILALASTKAFLSFGNHLFFAENAVRYDFSENFKAKYSIMKKKKKPKENQP
jgi:hypothetical protein